MLALIAYNGPLLALCVALGAVTSWWTFRGDRRKRRAKGEPKP